MKQHYMIRAQKIVTVSQAGTIENGALVVQNGKIVDVGKWKDMKKQHTHHPVLDYSDYVITPGLVDCHTHLLEFAPTSLYPVTQDTHLVAGKAILLQALLSGITALGEQICGHPESDFSIDDYRRVVHEFPIEVSFAATSISIGFDTLAHFTSVTKSTPVKRSDLSSSAIVTKMAIQNDYPGENIFINATPANFAAEDVPRAGELIYTASELKHIVTIFHQLKQDIGVHVAGVKEIQMALDAGVDVLHHAHAMTDELMEEAKKKNVKIVATPMGGTHLKPNSPNNILRLVQHQIPVSIATDAYLPPYKEAEWLPFKDDRMRGPDVLMQISQPAMQLLKEHGYDENDILALITRNPAHILRKGDLFGSLAPGMDAHFLVAEGIPGLDITDVHAIKQVYFKGNKVIDRLK